MSDRLTTHLFVKKKKKIQNLSVKVLYKIRPKKIWCPRNRQIELKKLVPRKDWVRPNPRQSSQPGFRKSGRFDQWQGPEESKVHLNTLTGSFWMVGLSLSIFSRYLTQKFQISPKIKKKSWRYNSCFEQTFESHLPDLVYIPTMYVLYYLQKSDPY